jgi:hypothetical protein
MGYPRVKNETHLLPITSSGLGRACPWVKSHTHTRTNRVGYPRIPGPMGKIAIPREGVEVISSDARESPFRREVRTCPIRTRGGGTIKGHMPKENGRKARLVVWVDTHLLVGVSF